MSDAATHRLVADPSPDLVLAATSWATNAQMIYDVARLGYLKRDWVILDMTFGHGTWWRVWQPYTLIKGDLYYQQDETVLCEDFRCSSYTSALYDAVTLDPPYVCPGGRESSGIPAFQQRYGMDSTPLTPAGVQNDINAGLNECYRVVKRGGIVLVKCQLYISSGKPWDGVFHTKTHAYKIGLELVDHLIHLGGPRPQPERPRQVHARRNHSDLLVFRKPKR